MRLDKSTKTNLKIFRPYYNGVSVARFKPFQTFECHLAYQHPFRRLVGQRASSAHCRCCLGWGEKGQGTNPGNTVGKPWLRIPWGDAWPEPLYRYIKHRCVWGSPFVDNPVGIAQAGCPVTLNTVRACLG